MGHGHSHSGPAIQHVGNGFYNIRGHFKILAGLVDLGTHMSLIKLPSGKFLVIDTVPLDTTATLKQELDELTENGRLIEAVVATHPFHTLAFPAFFEAYPQATYYGTPRHIRNQPQIPWVGSVGTDEVRHKWEPEVSMRIPAGSEFAAPQPEKSNHFNSVWVFHQASKTLHVDDTLMHFHDPALPLRLGGFKAGEIYFHPTLKNVGLLHTPEAPQQFRQFVENVIRDWDFDNVVAAHSGNLIGGAKDAVRRELERTTDTFRHLSERNLTEVAHETHRTEEQVKAEREIDCGEYNVDGNECG